MSKTTPWPLALIMAGASLLLLRPSPAAAESAYRRVLPGVRQAIAANGAGIGTSAWLVNLGESAGSYEFGFLPVSTAGAPTAQVPLAVRALGPGETLRLNRALPDLFGLSEGEGVLVVRGTQPFELRGVNATDPLGAAGMGANGFQSAGVLGPDASAHAIWLANRADPDSELRTEITAVLTAPNTAVTVSVYDASGLLRGIEVVTSAEPTVWRTTAARFLADPEVPIGRVKFAVTAGEATGFLALSGRANATAWVLPPERLADSGPDGVNLLVNGVTASSELRLFNPNESEQEIAIEAVGFGSPAPEIQRVAEIRRLVVAPKTVVELRGVLAGFADAPEATGALRLRSPQPFLAAGRSLPMAVVAESGFARPGRPVTLVGLNESAGQPGLLSRIALLAGTRGVTGWLRLRDSRGVAMATARLRLDANEWQGRSLRAWFPEAELGPDARVDVEVEDGSAHGYAEVVDSTTQSRVLVAAAMLPVPPAIPLTANRLVFSALPPSLTANAPFAVTVEALRADNAVDTRFAGSVDLRVASGPGGLQPAVTVSQVAEAGVVSIQALRLSVPGRYTLTALGAGLEAAVSAPFDVAAAPPPAGPTVIRTGTFAGQNGYLAEGTLQIERGADGRETLRLNRNFRVSAGAGAITVWLARASGPLNASSSVRVGTLTRVFAGEFTFAIPAPGSASFTHVIVYCDPFRINFGAAALRNP